MLALSTLRYLRVSNIAGSALLIWHLIRTGLFRTYRYFFAYLCFQTLRSLVLWPFNPNKQAYSWIWMISEPALWVLYILIVLELYSLVLRDYEGIRTAAAWALYGALVISVALSCLALLPEQNGAKQAYPWLSYFFLIERGVVSSLVLFLLLMAVFLMWCPIQFRRNTISHFILYSVYFLAKSIALLVTTLTGHSVTRMTSAVLLVATTGCLLAWVFALREEGENQLIRPKRDGTSVEIQGLIVQMETLNRTLLRAARR